MSPSDNNPDSGESSRPSPAGREEPAHRLAPESFKTYDVKSRDDGEILLGDDEQGLDPDRELEQEDHHHLIPPRHLLIGAGATVLIVATLVCVNILTREQELAEDDRSRDLILASEDPVRPATDPLDADQRQQRLEELAHGFTESHSIDELLPLCRPVPDLEERMRAYYEEQPLPGLLSPPVQVSTVGTGVSTGLTYQGAKVLLKDGSGFLALTCDLPEGIFLDWEATEVWQPCEWSELIRGQHEGPAQMRCYIRPDTLYLSPFSDETHLCLRISARKLKDPVFAYLPWDHPDIGKLQAILTDWQNNGPSDHEVILELSWVKNTSISHLMRVEKFISDSWIHPHRVE